MDISVIIPVYNRENVIKRCLDSIMNQSFENLEIIVIDDGSTDETINVIQQYRKNISGGENVIKLYSQEHLGAQAARNYGIRKAAGKWIAFLDSDDEWCTGNLKVKYEIAKDKTNIVICSTCYLVQDNSETIWQLPGKSGSIYKDLLRHPWPMLQGMLVEKSALEKIGLLDERCKAYQEWETSIRLAKFFDFIYIDKPLFKYYRETGSNAISNDISRGMQGWEYIVKKHKKAIVKECGRHVLANHYGILKNGYTGKKRLEYIVKYNMERILSILCNIINCSYL